MDDAPSVHRICLPPPLPSPPSPAASYLRDTYVWIDVNAIRDNNPNYNTLPPSFPTFPSRLLQRAERASPPSELKHLKSGLNLPCHISTSYCQGQGKDVLRFLPFGWDSFMM